MLTKAVRARTLHWHELGLLLRITGVCLALPVLHRLLTLPALLHVLDARAASPHRVTPDRLLMLVRGLCQLHAGVFRPNCLTQSLLLWHCLRRWGYPVQVCFGVVKDEEILAGHCWLELDGQPLAEPADPRQVFTVVYVYPEP